MYASKDIGNAKEAGPAAKTYEREEKVTKQA